MKVVYKWEEEQASETRTYIEDKITQLIKEKANSCHEDKIIVTLNIVGSLDNRIKGIVECGCGKKILAFEGDSSIKKLEISILNEN